MKLDDYKKADDLVRGIREIGYEVEIWKKFIIGPQDLYYSTSERHEGAFNPLGTSVNKEEFDQIRNFAIDILKRKKVTLEKELEKL